MNCEFSTESVEKMEEHLQNEMVIHTFLKIIFIPPQKKDTQKTQATSIEERGTVTI